VKQLVIDWTIGAPAPLPPVSQPQKGVVLSDPCVDFMFA
jgi:hypothetical protein